MIIVPLQEGLEELNILRRAVGLRNHKSLTDGMIIVEEERRSSSILIIDIDGIGRKN
jgi:hypothetical protein